MVAKPGEADSDLKRKVPPAPTTMEDEFRTTQSLAAETSRMVQALQTEMGSLVTLGPRVSSLELLSPAFVSLESRVAGIEPVAASHESRVCGLESHVETLRTGFKEWTDRATEQHALGIHS